MTAVVLTQSQVMCEFDVFKQCTNTIICKAATIEGARREAHSVGGWMVIEGRDICGDHVPSETRRLENKKKGN